MLVVLVGDGLFVQVLGVLQFRFSFCFVFVLFVCVFFCCLFLVVSFSTINKVVAGEKL